MSAWPQALILLLTLCGLTAAAPPQRFPILHDAYIWQRQWTPAVVASARASTGLIRDWRVLAAETDHTGRLRRTNVDWDSLAATGKPIVAVIRIDGQLHMSDTEALRAEVQAVLGAILVAIAGVEIDHDAATARLAAYARFLAALRAQLAPTMPLSITALPTWMGARDLPAVLAIVDEAVLQVHMVSDPRAGLVDARMALDWIGRWARQSPTPFRVALPSYGVRVHWNRDGTYRSVEAEAPLLDGGEAVELWAQPRDIARLLRHLAVDRPPGMTGVVWFRLPTEQDRRAWSLATWHAVIRGAPLDARIGWRIERTEIPGANHLVLANLGAADAELPRQVRLPEGCELADGANGYGLVRDGTRTFFERHGGGNILRSGESRIVGWMRCAPDRVEMDAQK
jgi:hypothetical protein